VETIQRLQYLRGLAALVVVLSHGLIKLDRICELQGWPAIGLSIDGTFGVDIFFVISGFLMCVTASGEFGKEGAPTRFLLRRVVRIVPLYWLFILVEVALRVAKPEAGGPAFGPAEIALSLAFIPYGLQDGIFRPVVGLGWSLDYEMFFYVLFAAGLLLRRDRGLILVGAALAGLVVAGQVLRPTGTIAVAWSAPVLLEFGIGVVLGRAYLLMRERGLPLRLPWPFLLTIAIVAAENALFPANDHEALGWRPLHWALAALIVGLNAFAAPDRAAERAPTGRFLRALGDSSYSLYLCHPVVLTVTARVWMTAGFGRALLPLYYVLAVAACIAAGWAIHRLVEKPLLARLMGRRAPPGSRPSGSPLAEGRPVA
jgi:exopolysaccharide production protein ExoZ